MGWKTDWLYNLLFDRVRSAWGEATRVHKHVHEHFQVDLYPELREPFLKRLVIAEFADADLSQPFCRGAVLRTWFYDGERFEPNSGPSPDPLIVERARRTDDMLCQFYEQGLVAFHVSPDRKQVVFTFVVGPRYARGEVFAVTGQGRTGELVPAPEYNRWIS